MNIAEDASELSKIAQFSLLLIQKEIPIRFFSEMTFVEL